MTYQTSVTYTDAGNNNGSIMGGQTKIEYAANSNMVVNWYFNGYIRRSVSTDAGATWSTPTLEHDGVGQGSQYAFCLDADDNMHEVIHRNSGATQYYFSTPNAGRTDWTIQFGVDLTYDPVQGRHPVITAHKDPTNSNRWWAHIVHTYHWTGNGYRMVTYNRIQINNNAGTYSSGGLTTETLWDGYVGWSYEIAPYASIDFRHNGDGKTNHVDGPNVYVAWYTGSAQTSPFRGQSNDGLWFRKLNWNGSSWYWNPGRHIHGLAESFFRYGEVPAQWLKVIYDGTAVMIGGQCRIVYAYDNYFDQTFLYERDEGDTSTTTRFWTTALCMYGSMGIDHKRNVFFAGQFGQSSLHIGEMIWRRWNGQLEGPWQIDPSTQPGGVSFAKTQRNSAIHYIFNDPSWLKLGRIIVNLVPNPPLLGAPESSANIDRSVAQSFTWVHQDPDGDAQVGYEIRTRPSGGSWTTVTQSTNGSQYHTYAANTFTGAQGLQYEWQVRTLDGLGWGSWSASKFFYSWSPPAAPTMTAPGAGGTIDTNVYAVTWTATGQVQYQVQVYVDSGCTILEYDSGEIANSAARSHGTPYPNLVNRTTRIRTSTATGIWGPWTTRTNAVSYAAPAEPTINSDFSDPHSLGFNTAVTIAVTHPIPVAPQPEVTAYEIWVRPEGDTGDGLVVGAGSPTVWASPASKTAYEVRVKMYTETGVTAYSAWTDVLGTQVDIRGFIVHDVGVPDEFVWVRLNDAGATDEESYEQALMTYQGRSYPVVEYGGGTNRVIDVPLIYSDDGQSEALRALLARRSILCYRDSKKRRVFGVANVSNEYDTFWGKKTSLNIIQVDFTEETVL